MFNKWFQQFYEQDLGRIQVDERLKKRLADQLELDLPPAPVPTLFTLFKPLLGLVALASIILAVTTFVQKEGVPFLPPAHPIAFGEPVDDWVFSSGSNEEASRMAAGMGSGATLFSGGTTAKMTAPSMASDALFAESALGFSVGGSKDLGSFRENIENDFLPIPESLTYEGIFYEYFFDTAKTEPCTELFCPSYARAISKNPFTSTDEYYLSVGLNSGISESDFARKPLNLVVVLDISGSMGSAFDRYYYDRNGTQLEHPEWTSDSKMQVATESIAALLHHLKPEDRVGIVLFDDQSYVAKPLRYVGETDMDALERHVLELSPQGGTNMEAGLQEATRMLKEVSGNAEYENRMIFLTDAMPNTGDKSKNGFMGITQQNADDHLYTTFIGIGVDFQAALIESITKVRGANYYSVHNAKEFSDRMDEGFEYMVTPLVFGLELQLESSGYEIEEVYGSPEADLATGKIMKVNTLFPSKTEGGETRGGLVLLKLRKVGSADDLSLSVRYEDREGGAHENRQQIRLNDLRENSYDNTGIRKGIALSRYVSLLKEWAMRARGETSHGGWEQASLPLSVGDADKESFRLFETYLRQEIQEIGDAELEQEIDLLEKLIRAPNPQTPSIPEPRPIPYPDDQWLY